MKKNILGISIAVILTLGMSGKAMSANVGDLMTTMFADTATNSTPGSYFETQRSGVLAGGRFSAKNHITRNLQIVGFVPPSLSSGCGGISAFGGSFSFINGDQLVSYLRDIGTNAVGYFFQLALESSCPTCAQIMNSLNDLASLVNGSLGDSCSAAKALVNGTGLGSVAKAAGQASKTATDSILGPMNKSIKDFHKGLVSKQESGEIANTIGVNLEVNIVYQKMRNAGFDNWIAVASNIPDELRSENNNASTKMPNLSELAMSLVGTTILKKQNVEVELKSETPNQTTNATVQKILPSNIAPTLNFEDFWGRESGGNANNTSYTAKKNLLEYYRCAKPGDSVSNLIVKTTNNASDFSSNEKCVHIVKEKTLFVPFREVIAKYLTDGSSSLAVRIRERKVTSTDPNEREKYERLRNLMTNVEAPVFAHLQKLSLHKDAASSWVTNSADYIAISYVSGMLNQILDAIQEADAAGSSFNQTLAGTMSLSEKSKRDLEQQLVNDPIIEKILEVKSKINEENKRLADRFIGDANRQIAFKALLDSIVEALGRRDIMTGGGK